MGTSDHDEKDKKGTWTCTPGWCGYVDKKTHDGADAPSPDKPADGAETKAAADAEKEKGTWTCNGGWCGYTGSKPVEDAARPAKAPEAEAKPEDKDGAWTCTPGWCGYVKKKDHDGKNEE